MWRLCMSINPSMSWDVEDPHDLLSVRIEDHGPDRVVVVRGEVDLCTAAILEAALVAGGAGTGALVVDLTAVDYLGARGFGLLLTAAERVRARGGELRLAGGGPLILRTLRLLGQDRCPRHYPDLATALSGLSGLDLRTPIT
jgi:anti-anti-sigma factor